MPATYEKYCMTQTFTSRCVRNDSYMKLPAPATYS